MNVVFHTITGTALSKVLSSSKKKKPASWKILLVGFLLGVFFHGVLDFLPHQYPFSAKVDILFSLFLAATVFFWAIKKEERPLFFVCFLGSIFPDLIDLGPAMINDFLGTDLPVVKIFPWHWPEFSGSIFDGRNTLLSHFNHFLVLLVALFLFFRFRKK